MRDALYLEITGQFAEFLQHYYLEHLNTIKSTYLCRFKYDKCYFFLRRRAPLKKNNGQSLITLRRYPTALLTTIFP